MAVGKKPGPAPIDQQLDFFLLPPKLMHITSHLRGEWDDPRCHMVMDSSRLRGIITDMEQMTFIDHYLLKQIIKPTEGYTITPELHNKCNTKM